MRRREPKRPALECDDSKEKGLPFSDPVAKSGGDGGLERLRDFLDSVSFDREPTEAERALAAREAEDDDSD